MKNIFINRGLSWTCIFAFFTFVYIICHGPMLFTYGAWWDDVLLWNVPYYQMEEMLGPDNMNNPVMLTIIKLISRINDLNVMTFVFRLTSFMLGYISLASIYLIIKKITECKTFTLITMILAASCAINKTMFLICCLHYMISNTLFFMGLVFFVYDYYNPNKIIKIVTALLWFCSLFVWRSPVLVIPVVVFASSIFHLSFNWREKKCYIELIKYIFGNYWQISLMLLIFIILYAPIISPRGDHSSYYAVGISKVLFSPITTFTYCIGIFIQYFVGILSAFAEGIQFFVSIPLFFLVFFILKFRTSSLFGISRQKYMFLLILAILVMYFSIMPHMLREGGIRFSHLIDGYSSRHASLCFFSISIIISLFISSLKSSKGLLFVSFIVTANILFSIGVFLDYNRGWAKKECFTNFVRNNKEIEDKQILVVDGASLLSPFDSEKERNYDFDCCARYVFGFETNTKFVSYMFDGIPLNYIPDYVLYIYSKTPEVRNINKHILPIKLLYERSFNKTEYKKDIDNLMIFELVPFSDKN